MLIKLFMTSCTNKRVCHCSSFLCQLPWICLLSCTNMANTTPKKRASIITLHSHSQKSSREIASIMSVSQSTVSRILQRFKKNWFCHPQTKRKMWSKVENFPRDDKFLHRLNVIDPGKTSSDLKKDMMAYGVHIGNTSKLY